MLEATPVLDHELLKFSQELLSNVNLIFFNFPDGIEKSIMGRESNSFGKLMWRWCFHESIVLKNREHRGENFRGNFSRRSKTSKYVEHLPLRYFSE